MVQQNYPEKACCICTDEFVNNNFVLDCGHWVHKKCIEQSYSQTCPICRKPVSVKVRERVKPDEDFFDIDIMSEDFISRAHSHSTERSNERSNEWIVSAHNTTGYTNRAIASWVASMKVFAERYSGYNYEFWEEDINFVESFLHIKNIPRNEMRACQDAYQRAVNNRMPDC